MSKIDISVSVDKMFLIHLKSKLNETSDVKVMRAALTLLDWAVDEKTKNREIFSSDKDGKDISRLVMKELENI